VSALRGRESEAGALARVVTAAADGAGGVVVVEGPPGIGKSRLLAEAASFAADQGVQIAAGAADELDQVTPWAPLLRALSSTSPIVLSKHDLAAFRGLLDQRLALIERIREALEESSRNRALLITLDDLQWADAATVLALGLLPAQLFSYPVAWVLALRPSPSSPQLQGLAARLDEAGATRLHLGPLAPPAVRALAADILGEDPDASVIDVIARADGSPLYAIELLRAAAASASAPCDSVDLTTREVPASLRSIIAAHLRWLSVATQDLLSVASVLGREFTVSELAAVSGRSASQLLEPIGEALRAEVITENKDRLAFRHDLLRESLYADLPTSLRRALHRDAAAALRREGASLVRVAGQYAAGSWPGDDEAIEVLGTAAGELFGTSPSAAADLALRAVELLPAHDQRRPALSAMAIRLLGWAGRLEEARAFGEGYLATHQVPPQEEAEILLGIRRAWTTGLVRPYPAQLPAHILDNPAVQTGIRANLLAIEQLGRIQAGDFAAADQGFSIAMRLVAEAGEDIYVAAIVPFWVVTDAMQGKVSQGLDRARGFLERYGGPQAQPPIAATMHHQIALCLGGLGRTEEALAAITEAARAADSCGLSLSVHARYFRSVLLHHQGRLDDACAEARTAAGYAQALGLEECAASSLTALTELLIRKGELSEANTVAAPLIADADSGSLFAERYWARSLVLDALGKPQAALEALDPVFEKFSRGPLLFACWQASRLPKVVELAMRADNDDRAGRATAVAKALADANPAVSLHAAIALHARALMDHDPELLQQAVEMLTGCQWPLATAFAREHLGRLLAGHGQTDTAIAALEAAYATYTSASAHRDTARVRRALRELGVRKRRAAVARPHHGWASLTSAELAVVDVVAAGASNKDAAAQLFLSPDTVNTHLRHAFAKLQIRSRVDLARLAARRETQSR
jgi:DNA-binding CsgD family transcriptional regulator